MSGLDSFSLVMVGHIDHGKSTIIGRLLLDTNSLPASTKAKILTDGADKLELAHIMDHFREERDQGITIDIAHKYFNTDRRRYVIIDAPGHKEFVKNMLSGSAQADGALLLVDATEGIQEQTKRHIYILSLIGITQVSVVVNKMDSVGWSEEVFKNIASDVKTLLASRSIAPQNIIPVSAMFGGNVVNRYDEADWYTGPTTLEALDSFKAQSPSGGKLCLPIQDVYDFYGDDLVYVGRVESGILKVGAELSTMPSGAEVTVQEILKLGEEGVATAESGEAVAIKIKTNKEIVRGEVLVSRSEKATKQSLLSHIFWLSKEPVDMDKTYQFKCASHITPCHLLSIENIFDPGDDSAHNSEELGESKVADVQISLEKPTYFCKFTDVAAMGRFVLEDDDHVLAVGTITA